MKQEPPELGLFGRRFNDGDRTVNDFLTFDYPDALSIVMSLGEFGERSGHVRFE